MRAVGAIRRVDELGRIVLPKEVRDALGFVPGAKVRFSVADEGQIVLERMDGPTLADALGVLRVVQNQLDRQAKGLPVDWDLVRREVAGVLGE